MNAPVLKPISGNWNFCGLDWQTYADPADGFNVYRKLSTESTYTKIIEDLPGQTIHCGCGPSGVTFNFYITAEVGGVEGPASNVENFTVPNRPRSI